MTGPETLADREYAEPEWPTWRDCVAIALLVLIVLPVVLL